MILARRPELTMDEREMDNASSTLLSNECTKDCELRESNARG